MSSLSSPLRKQLETAITAARKTAEAGARKALEALAVHEADPYRHMDDAQRTLRRKLRAQARQLGDAESHSRPGTYDIHHLAEKVAYDQWHRLLFARFLLENNLLISPEHGVAVTLADCEELASSLGLKDAWAVAGRFVAAILPQAFRADDPAGMVPLPIEERNQLLRLLADLPVEIFTATDSLGWTYQFWQAERKDQVNAAGNKIGADELPSVTQLFTEDYMVDFLLDNTLGAWHAGKVLAANPKLAETAQSEDELRQAVALPGCPWKYLRFVQRGTVVPPVFDAPQRSTGVPPVFDPPQRSTGVPPVFDPPQRSTGVPPVFDPPQRSTGVPPVFDPPQRGTGVPPVFDPPQRGTGVPPVDPLPPVHDPTHIPHGRDARAPFYHDPTNFPHGRDARAPFLNPYQEIDTHERNLPHWQQDTAWTFVTWRLADSLPGEKLALWRAEKEAWLKLHPQPWNAATTEEYHDTFSHRMDEWLDAGAGSCVLAQPDVRKLVADALQHFDGQRYELGDFVVMPNHVHVLFRPCPGQHLSDILHSWKSYTSKQINKALGQAGPLWQEEYWDRIIRNERHLAACRRYIAENPAKAGLPAHRYSLRSTGVPPVFDAPQRSTGVPPVDPLPQRSTGVPPVDPLPQRSTGVPPVDHPTHIPHGRDARAPICHDPTHIPHGRDARAPFCHDPTSFPHGRDARAPFWTPAAGSFDAWPQSAADIRALDPCMGSGHFIVALFQRLVALRIAQENLDLPSAVSAVLRDNLFGLEIDPRCTQIAAFNLALAAWKHVGHCKLPAMNLACSGLAPNAQREDWLRLTEGAPHLRFQMGALYDLFEKAPALGSLINPVADKAVTYGNAFHELQPLLEKALAQETKDDTAHEMAVTARGLAKAAEILAGQFTLVATNVPYLGLNKQDEQLRSHCAAIFPNAKSDLAACFVERCFGFCGNGGSTALVTPQSWLFLGTYKKLREVFLADGTFNAVAKLGPGAFETISGEVVNAALIQMSRAKSGNESCFVGIDVTDETSTAGKAEQLRVSTVMLPKQCAQTKNADSRIVLSEVSAGSLLLELANSYEGIGCGDLERFSRVFTEVPSWGRDWRAFRGTTKKAGSYAGAESIIYWQDGKSDIYELAELLRDRLKNTWQRGCQAWDKRGLAVNRMGDLLAEIYEGEIFDSNIAAIIPKTTEQLLPIWLFVSSDQFREEVRRIDQSIKITNVTFLKVPFDLAHWQKVAAEKYPHGLPKPFSSDPTQWLFNGHPAGADQPLHVAVARLLGYQWPRQTGSSFPDCPALGPDGLETLADDDGIVCLASTKGEPPAAERLRALLVQALGSFDPKQLLASAGPKGSRSETLDDWLRDEVFEQHCALFHHRPFLWHVWDGLKNGFSALVNYHKLTHANLEKLTFAYLGDWIRRQQAAVAAEEAGSDAKLQAAKALQATLKLILEGEPPHDIFVRWKGLSQQAIGWHPDLNDGVRMNIRPFMLAPDVGKKGAGILRAKPNIKWDKDRGKEPRRDKAEFPWFWGWDEEKQDFAGVGKEPDGNRWNDCHYTNEFKRRARKG